MKKRAMRFFYFFLARELGMTVKELLRRIDSREITEWMVYFNILNDRDKPEKNKKEVTSSMQEFFRSYKGG